MPPKKNRLDDARRRLKEKLDSIKEQSEYITQTLTTAVSNATHPAFELLNLQDKKKFFHKYPKVSQDLEKCLDFLLALTDTVDTFDEDDSDTGSDDAADSDAKDEQKETDQSKRRIAAKFTSDTGSAKTTSTEGKSETNTKKQASNTTHLVDTDTSNHGDHQVDTNNSSYHGDNKSQQKVNKTSTEQGKPFQEKQKQFTSIGFEDILSQEVDMEKVNSMDTIKPWVTKRITELLLGVKDDVVLEFIEKMLESKKPDPQLMQITLTGFLQAKNARIFMGELWERLISAQNKCPSQLTEKISIESGQVTENKLEKDHMNDKNTEESRQETDDKPAVEKYCIKNDNLSKLPISSEESIVEISLPFIGKNAEGGQTTNNKLPPEKGHITNSDSSQLKMPKAFIQKGIKKDNNQDKKGRRSPSIHVKEEKTSVLKRKLQSVDLGIPVVQVNPYPFKSGKCLEVVVTEVLSPWELWIQPADNGFNLLMERMCLHFAKAAASGNKGGLTVPPSVGEYCCARFMDDDTWYRVIVIGSHQSCDKPNQGNGRARKSSTGSTSSTSSIDNHYPGLEIDVLCIDDGSRDRLPLSRLRRLDSALADIPCQALCCALNGVQPLVKNPVKSQGDSLWKEESIEWLRNKVSGVKLLAYPKRTDDEALIMVDLYLTNKKKQGPGSNIPGKHSTLPGLQYSIAHIMVLEGFAQHVGHVTESPANSKASSPQSVTSEGKSSRRSSLSVASLQEEDKPAYDQNVTQEPSTEANKGVTKGTKDTKVVQDKHDSKSKGATKKTSDKRSSRNAETNAPQQRHFTKGKEGTAKGSQVKYVTKDKGRSSISTDAKLAKDIDAKPTDQPSENIVKDEPLEQRIDEKKTTEVRYQESHESETQDVDRASPRYPPEGSSHTDSIKDLADSIQRQDESLFLQVMMSEVVNPSEFYVHLITPEAVLLGELTEDLESYYKDSDIKSMPEDYRLSVGDFCCAKFSKDNMWCRAKVLEVQVSPSGDGDSELVANIYVFYVDYGNCEWVAMGDTRPLLAKFMMLPGFAVKSRLAGVQPVAIQDTEAPASTNEVPDEQKDLDSEQNQSKNPGIVKEDESSCCAKPATNDSKTKQPLRKFTKGKRGKKNQKLPLHDRNVVLRAAGDESGDSELSDGGLIFDSAKDEEKDMTSKEGDEPALPEMYLVASPDKSQSPDITSTITRKPEWTEEAIELFKGLTGDDKPLRGIMVPRDSTTYQQVYYPAASYSFVDITYQRPTLVLQLYDTTGDEDVDITQIMVETGLAELVDENSQGGKIDRENIARVLHLSVNDLENTADQLDKEGKNSSPLVNSDSDPEDDDMMKFFNPMMDDYKSSRNAYGIDTNDPDIAIHGFKPIETQYCKFYRSAKSRCWRGENCPMLHVKEGEDATVRVQAFCNNNDFTVDLPRVNSWIGVRVTAVVNPGHFWVQFPCGSGPIEKKIIEERLGLITNEDHEEEDFDAMSERMNKFYTRNIFRESNTILPAPGELVAAKYTQNEQWYRACVLDVKEEAIKVSFVDYGNSEWTEAANVKRMLPQFLHMPFQAVECFLGNIEPVENGEWTQESINVFESLTQDKLLIAHVLSISWNNTMWLELFDTQTEPEININEEMIKHGFACESQVKITIPPSPGSQSSTGSPDASDCEIVFVPG